MLVQTFLVLSNWEVILFADVINQDYSILSSAGNQVWIFNAELASCDLGITEEYFLGEGWVFQSQEH